MRHITKMKWNDMSRSGNLAAACDPGGNGRRSQGSLSSHRFGSGTSLPVQESGRTIVPGTARCRRIRSMEIPMDRDTDGKPPATAGEAAALAVRLLRFQVDLSGCCVDTVTHDSFVAGYLWGFCGGILTGLRAISPGLFPLHSMVCRALFGDRDGASMVEHIARVRESSDFVAGERAGFADALRYATEGRAGAGLVGHLAGRPLRDARATGRDPLE